MRIAPIFPTAAVDLAPVTGYQLCFAELALQDKVYADHFRWRGHNGVTNEIVIMDTFVYENAIGVTPDDLVEAVGRVRPSYVVVPDVVGDMPATMANFGRYATKLQQVWGTYGNLVGVPQGRTLPEFIDCAKMLKGLATHLAVGAATSDIVRKSRADLLMHILHETGGHSGLLLGMRRDFAELAAIKEIASGLDTAKPVYYGLLGEKYAEANFNAFRRPTNYFDIPRDRVVRAMDLIAENIKWLQTQVA